jgi:cobalamin synthase
MQTEFVAFPVISSFPLYALSTIRKRTCLACDYFAGKLCATAASSQRGVRSGDMAGQACGPKRVWGAVLPLYVLPATSVFFSLPSYVTVMIVAVLKILFQPKWRCSVMCF